jgi:hypothetical protein
MPRPYEAGSACVVTATYDANQQVLQQAGDCVWVARMSAAICGLCMVSRDPGYRFAHPGYTS